MKKFTSAMLSLLLAVVVVFSSVGGAKAAAVTPPDEEGKERWSIFASDDDTVDPDGTWEWKKDAKTLTLNNFSFTTEHHTGLFLPAGATIVFIGANSITSNNAGGVNSSTALYVNGIGPLTLSGEAGATLTLTGGPAPTSKKSHGIGIYGDLTVTGGMVEATTMKAEGES